MGRELVNRKNNAVKQLDNEVNQSLQPTYLAAPAAGAGPGSYAPASGEDHAGDGTLALAYGGVVFAVPGSWASVLIALAARPGAGPGAGPGPAAATSS